MAYFEDVDSRPQMIEGELLIESVENLTGKLCVQTKFSQFSQEQISKLEEIVKNFITNARAADNQPLGSTLALMGHGSHNNENGATPKSRSAPATKMKKQG